MIQSKFKRRVFAALVIALLTNVACAAKSPPAASEAKKAAVDIATDATPSLVPPELDAALKRAEFEAPEQKNYTPFPTVMTSGSDQWGEYWSTSIKLSFSFDAAGQMQIDSVNSEDTIDENDDPKNDYECTAKGGALNQRTTWFPDTGIFVRGGKLSAIKRANAERMPMLPLTKSDYGLLMLVGEKARAVEMGYVPCVGRHRAAAGHRTLGFLSAGTTLEIQPQSGNKISLTIPSTPQPFLMLRFRKGEIIPTPMRIVLLTVDVQEKRVVMQLQSTFPVRPALRKIDWMAIMPDDKPDPSETPERSLERTRAIAGDLARCPLPLRPMEPCATPRRSPDPLIYFPSNKP